MYNTFEHILIDRFNSLFRMVEIAGLVDATGKSSCFLMSSSLPMVSVLYNVAV